MRNRSTKGRKLSHGVVECVSRESVGWIATRNGVDHVKNETEAKEKQRSNCKWVAVRTNRNDTRLVEFWGSL